MTSLPPPDAATTALDAVSLGTSLRGLAAAAPDAVSLRSPDHEPTDRRGLVEQLDHTSRQLLAANLHRLSCVAVVLPSGPCLAMALVSVAAAAQCAPIDPNSTADEISFVLRDTHAAAIIVPDHGHPAAELAAATVGCSVLVLRQQGTAGRFVLRHQDPERAVNSQSPVAPGSTALLLHTSGTTARPKLVALSHDQLLDSAQAVARSLALSPHDRSLAIMPLFHVHGIVAALLGSLLSGGEVVVPVGHTSADLAALVESTEPTWLTAVPTMLQSLVWQCEQRPITHKLRVVRSCSSALPLSVAEGIERRLGVPVVEAYGMTEGAHQIASQPLAPTTRRAGSVGFSSGPTIAIVDLDGSPVPAHATGEVVLRGPSIITHYVDNAAADAAAFREGWFRTGDLGRFDDEGWLFLVGRIKELINRAGEKIAPREVEEALLGHPAVREAIVFAVRDRRLGEQVAAAVTLNAPISETALRMFAAENLAAFKVPRRIVFCEEIPKGPTGKAQRRLLAELLDLADLDDVGVRLSPRQPDGPLEELLAEWWTQVLRQPVVDVNAHFLDVGGDSLGATRLLSRIRSELDVELGLIELFDARTIAEQASLLEGRLLDD